MVLQTRGLAAVDFWDRLGLQLERVAAALAPEADTTRMDKALNDLRTIMNMKGEHEMSTPTPDPIDEVKLSQSVIDGWANAIESTLSAMRAIIARGQLQPADLASMTQAVTDLEQVTNAVPDTPPVNPTP